MPEQALGSRAIVWIERLPDVRKCEVSTRANACGLTVAAPAPIGRVLDLPGSDRIEHHVSQYSEKAWPAFYDLCLVPSLQDMADAMMSPVEPAAIRAVDVVHQSREWMRRGPKQQVNVIWHEPVSK